MTTPNTSTEHRSEREKYRAYTQLKRNRVEEERKIFTHHKLHPKLKFVCVRHPIFNITLLPLDRIFTVAKTRACAERTPTC